MPRDFHAAVDTTCRRENGRKMHLEIFMPLSIPLVVGRMAERCTWRFSCRCRYHLSSGEWPKDALAWCQHMIHHEPPGLMPAHGMPFAHLLEKCNGEPNPQGEYQDSERDPRLRDWETRRQKERNNFEKRTKMGTCIYSAVIMICELDIHESR